MTFSNMEVDTGPNINISNEKIGRVLQKFLDPNFKVKNDVHLNLFLTRLLGKNGDGKTSRVQTNEQLKEQFCRWIIDASELWGKTELSPPATILSFALNLTSQLSCDEHTFVDLNCQNVFESLVGVAQANSTRHPSVTLGMITLFCSFLEHKSGVQWVVATTHWIDVINLGLKVHSMYIGKKAHQFVIKLLEKTIRFNRNFAVNLVAILIGPLKDVVRSLPNNEDARRTQIGSRELFKTLQPTLDCLSEVLTTLLKNFNSNVLLLFLQQGAQETAEQILLFSQSEDFSFKLLKITFVFLFYKLCVKLDGLNVVEHDSLVLYDMTVMFDLIKNEMIKKDNVRCVVKISDYAHGLYSSLALHMPLCVRKGEVIGFQNQMVLFQIMPLLVFGVQILGCPVNPEKIYINDAFRKDFIQKLLRLAAIKSIEICYKWKEILQSKPDLMEDVTFSLQYLAKTKKWLNKERAATMFPALVYALKDSLTIMRILIQVNWTPRYIKYITTLLKTIVDLVESFDLTWRDSIETLHVMDLACEFLQYPDFPDKTIIITGLKLLKTAISKYMSPNMVLLIYSTKDSTVSQAGSLLYTKCRDATWEIRDSALDVVHTLSQNANSMFPALENVLLDAELPQLVVNMALKDDESTVRASAFKCLQELTQISEIWDVLLSVDSFLNNLLSVFENEIEGIVRKEATILVHRIYTHQEFPVEILPRLYDVMSHAALCDSHWEVKCNALEFWFESWREHLTNQGMIDSKFPSHTFSKEHKKIVILNDAEIRKRVIKILNQLSHTGCLHVLKCAFQDDRDAEVSKKAAWFNSRILLLFQRYKVPYEDIDSSDPSSPPMVQSGPQYPLFEPVSPASSTTMTAPNPGDIGDLGSPQVPNSPYFDPLSPFPAPFSPLPNLDLMMPSRSMLETPTYQNTQYTTPHDGNTTMPNLNTEEGPLFDNTAANRVSSNLTPNLFDMDMCGDGEGTFTTPKLEDVRNVQSNCIDPVTRELDDLLNSKDMTLLEGAYNPSDQVTNNVTNMKSRTYLAPSEYVRFVFEVFETQATDKSQRLDGLEEIDPILDDILKEYNIATDISSMDY